MSEISSKRPWETLHTYLESDNAEELNAHFHSLNSDEIVLALSHLNKEDRNKLISMLSPSDAAETILEIPDVQATEILENIATEDAAAIIDELKSNEQVDMISEMESDNAEAILAEMNPEDVENVRMLMEYDPDTAGGLMITEFLAFDEQMTVRQVADQLQETAEEYAHYNVQYIYVTAQDKFAGVLQLRHLVMTRPDAALSEVAIKNALTVTTDAPLEDLIHFFDHHDFYGVPVLDEDQRLVGVVLRKDILKEENAIASKELLETQGIVGGEELRTMPYLLRSKRRLSWLSVNIILNIIAASVIAMYQDTLSSMIALAVFLPIISDMSGCSGNQAVAVSMRELSLGVVKPFEVTRVWLQELSVGLINGFVLGVLLGFAAWLWQGNIYLSLVVGMALCLNTLIAVSIGGTIPLLLKRMDVDPALASGPILTTITDMIGFFLALSLAAYAISQFPMV